MSAITWLEMLINPELLRVRPKLIRPIVTQNCPLSCKMCTFWRTKSVNPSLDLVKHWIHEAKDFGAIDCSLGGGEPPVRKDICEIVHEVKQLGMSCGMTTSGWFVNEWKSGKRKFPDELDRIDLSIDGYNEETHDRIRCKGSWERAMACIDYVLDNELCEISQINFVLHPWNYKELPAFCELMDAQGLKVSLIPLCTKLAAQDSVAGSVPSFENLEDLISQVYAAYDVGNIITPRTYFDYAVWVMMERRKSPSPCLAPYVGLLIFADGGVYPCGVFDHPVAYLTENAHLVDIWNSSEFKDTRSNIRGGRYKFCQNCYYVDLVPKSPRYQWWMLKEGFMRK